MRRQSALEVRPALSASSSSRCTRGVTRESLKVGTELVIDGYQARDHSLLRANGRNVTYPDGKKLFLGSSGTGAPTDGADPTEPPKPAGRGRGGF